MKIYIGLFLILSTLILSCKKDPKTATAPAQQSNKDLNETKETIQVTFANNDLDQLYKDYLEVKAALVNSNSEQTQAAAKTLAKNASDKVEVAAARQVAVLMSNEKNLKQQREFFVGLNTEVLQAIKGNITSGKVVQQFCPMAFNGKGGVWLSNSAEVRNPFYGDEMLVCGYVKEEFAAAPAP